MISICVPRRVLEVDDGFASGQRQLCHAAPRHHAQVRPCSGAGVGGCAGGAVGCAVHRSGFALCLRALAGLTGLETGDVCAVVVIVVEGRSLVSLL